MAKHLFFSAISVFPLLVVGRAHAQDYYSADLSPKRRAEPQWAFEIRFGPYLPDVDAGVPGFVPCPGNTTGCVQQKPFDKTFGSDHRILVSAELDWEAYHFQRWITVGVGGLIGYTKASGTAQFTDGSEGSAEPADLSIWIFGALGVLRVDGFANHLGVPIVPYVKAGPAVGYWSSSNGRGVSNHDGVEGRGHTVGTIWAIGGALQLDWFDRQAAKTFEAERGVFHTYAFAEYTVLQLHGIGQSNAMWLGDKTWTAGLSFEF